MQQSELKPMLMITNVIGKPQQFLKVSTLDRTNFTAILEYPIPGRTSVRTIRYDALDGYRPLNDAEFKKYNRVWDEATGKKRR